MYNFLAADQKEKSERRSLGNTQLGVILEELGFEMPQANRPFLSCPMTVRSIRLKVLLLLVSQMSAEWSLHLGMFFAAQPLLSKH